MSEDSPGDIIEGRPKFDYWARVNTDGLAAVVAALPGPVPPLGFLTDGCTHCPDFLGDIPLWPACGKHDWWYDERCTEIPDTPAGRLTSDNLLEECIDITAALYVQGEKLELAKVAADDIWAAVRVFAESHFKT